MQPIIALRCPGTFVRFQSNHAPLRAREAAQCGSGMVCTTVLRTPWQRTFSGFFHNLHDCFWMQRAHGLAQDSAPSAAFYHHYTGMHVRLYAACVRDCATRMIAGLPCGRCTPLKNSPAMAERCVSQVWADALADGVDTQGQSAAPRPALTGDPLASLSGRTLAVNDTYLRALVEAATDAKLRRSTEKSALDLAEPGVRTSLARALSTLARFAFVGVTDNWNRTLLAFSRQFDVTLLASDFKVLRKGWRALPAARLEATTQALRNFSFDADATLVQVAWQRLVHARRQRRRRR